MRCALISDMLAFVLAELLGLLQENGVSMPLSLPSHGPFTIIRCQARSSPGPERSRNDLPILQSEIHPNDSQKPAVAQSALSRTSHDAKRGTRQSTSTSMAGRKVER